MADLLLVFLASGTTRYGPPNHVRGPASVDILGLQHQAKFVSPSQASASWLHIPTSQPPDPHIDTPTP